MPKQKKYSIKQILLNNHTWWRFYQKHQSKIRAGILVAILKLLSCKTEVYGFTTYRCSNPQCSHSKKVFHTCKSKACSSCGKKATDVWIQTQMQRLPNTPWQHITFTIPSELWDFFWTNRCLLNFISALAANCIKKLAKNKKVLPGIFSAIHTFGRDLKRNVHVHLSVTLGGISDDGTQWKNLSFHQKSLMKLWRYAIIDLFRQLHKQKALVIPTSIQNQLNSIFTFESLLNQLYSKTWVVHCAKPSKNHKKNVQYLGRYIKRPPIAESKLIHYSGSDIQFKFLDHHYNTYRRFTLSVENFIKRFISHIPDIGFRMVRYYGFLAHRVRGILLPKVYELINQQPPDEATPSSSYAIIMQKNFNVNPLQCILCKADMFYSECEIRKPSISSLIVNHKKIAMPTLV